MSVPLFTTYKHRAGVITEPHHTVKRFYDAVVITFSSPRCPLYLSFTIWPLSSRNSPREKVYIESFNGKLSDELLTREIFIRLTEAKVLIAESSNEYNRFRPHSSLHCKPRATEAKMLETPTVQVVPFPGARQGYAKAKETFVVCYYCSACGKSIYVQSFIEKKAIAGYMKEHGWVHNECPRE